MKKQSTLALGEIVGLLSRTEQAYLCDGNPDQAVVWSSSTEITVRLAAQGDDQVWVLAGSGLLIRFVAASDGDFGDIAQVVRHILSGKVVEMFGEKGAPTGQPSTPTGYSLGEGMGFMGGLTEDESLWTAYLSGPFSTQD